jgi:hypothetical protein
VPVFLAYFKRVMFFVDIRLVVSHHFVMLRIRNSHGIICLSGSPVGASTKAPPTEILLVRYGVNKSQNGDFVFDDEAARATMSAWQLHSSDNQQQGMIDLEHLSLINEESPRYDPDARGWFDLELRDDGLWMVNIKWTDDGANRLKSGTQRYLSPAFRMDDNGRMIQLVNVALTSLPAMYDAPELIAAKVKIGKSMKSHDVDSFLKAIKQKSNPKQTAAVRLRFGPTVVKHNATEMDSESAIRKILQELGYDPNLPEKMAELLGLTGDVTFETLSSSIMKFMELWYGINDWLSSYSDGGVEQPPDVVDTAMKVDIKTDSQAEVLAILRSLVGCATNEEAILAVAKNVKINRDEEDIRRRSLVASLVKSGAETPATAWKRGASGLPNSNEAVDRLVSEPIGELQARVLAIMSMPKTSIQPPVDNSSGLTAYELAVCKAKKIDPKDFLQMKERVGG